MKAACTSATRGRGCDLASWMTSHTVRDRRKAVTAHDGVFVVVAYPADVRAADGPQFHHRLLP